MLLSVIIVSYNTKALTLQAVESVCGALSRSEKLRDQSEVWVVDNSSTDGSSAALRELAQKLENVHFIQNTSNAGFAAANNLALKEASGELLLLLNSDTLVNDDALERMVGFFEDHPLNQETAVLERTSDHIDHVGIVSADLRNPDGTAQAQGGSFPTLWSLSAHMLMLDDLPVIGRFFRSTQHTGKNAHHTEQSAYLMDWVGGTAMMIRREVIAEVGLLDENIFMYGEDVEFCMRAKFHHWDVVVLPGAKITHFGSASSSSKNAIIGELKGYIYIWSKHKPIWQKPFAKWLIQLGILIRIILFDTMVHDEHKVAIYKEANRVVRSL